MNKLPNSVNFAFDLFCELIELDDILLTKNINSKIRCSRKYKQIEASIHEIGVIEPPAVSRINDKSGKYLLLDGHLRIEVLKELGEKNITCLISTDDEGYTFNKQISRLSAVQEHKMILKAVESGVPQEKIAAALAVNISTIRQKRTLLDGICPEVVEFLKNKHCPGFTFQMLKKMKPIRQLEVAELMIKMNNFSRSYARATLLATPTDQLVKPEKAKNFKGVSSDQVARMEREMAKLQQKMALIGESYGPDHLNLVLAKGYISSLLQNAKVSKYLEKNHDGILSELKTMTEVSSVDETL